MSVDSHGQPEPVLVTRKSAVNRGEPMPISIAETGRGRVAQQPIATQRGFLREVVPKLDAYSLSQIAKATGLSLAACSRSLKRATEVQRRTSWSIDAFSIREQDR